MELPAEKEYGDNIVAFWRPDAPPEPGAPVEFSYRLIFGFDPPAPELPGRVVATRMGNLPDAEKGRLFWIDFNGEGLEKLDAETVGIAVEPTADVKIRHHTVIRLPGGRGWRAMIQAVPTAEAERAELRCTLRQGYEPVSETWTFAWQP